MEDRYGAFRLSPNCHVMYVADGHGGPNAVQAIHSRIKEIARATLLGGNGAADVPDEAVHELFRRLDKVACADLNTDGSTLVLAIDCPHEIVVAHCGDSKALLYSSATGELLWESENHDAHNDNERRRVRNAGSYVFNDRLMGMLSVTRSLGDRDYKPYGLSFEPDIERVPKTDHDADSRVMVLASDGLWTGHNPCDFHSFMSRLMSESHTLTPKEIATQMLRFSKQIDNTSVLVCKV